jgi:hypothetical protein
MIRANAESDPPGLAAMIAYFLRTLSGRFDFNFFNCPNPFFGSVDTLWIHPFD